MFGSAKWLAKADLSDLRDKTDREFPNYAPRRRVLELLSKGKISTGKAGELLGRTIYEIQDKLREKGIAAGATLEQHEQSRKNAKQHKRK